MVFEIENEEGAEKKEPVKPAAKPAPWKEEIEEDDDLGLGDEEEPTHFPHAHPDPPGDILVVGDFDLNALPPIEKGIPIPDKRGFKKIYEKPLWRVLLERMTVGDSVFLARTPLKKTAHWNKAARDIGLVITQRAIDGGVRIWLKEKIPSSDPDIGV